MQLSNEVILRPRFQMELKLSRLQVIAQFTNAKKKQKAFGISHLDDHIFLRLPAEQQLFWAPQLHLEIYDLTENTCRVHGFFGPNPTVWTMFIFFHVVVGTLFLGDMIWLYSNYNLGNEITVQLFISFALISTWIFLYIAGSLGKKKGKPGMRELYRFMLETIG